MGSSWTRDWTSVTSIAKQILNHWTTREACVKHCKSLATKTNEFVWLFLNHEWEKSRDLGGLLTCWKKVLGSNKSDNTMLRPEGHWDNPKIPSIGPMPKLRDYALCTCVFGVFLSKAEWPLMMCTWDLSLAAVPYPLPVGHSTHMGLEQWLDLASPPHHIFLSFVSKFFK